MTLPTRSPDEAQRNPGWAVAQARPTPKNEVSHLPEFVHFQPMNPGLRCAASGLRSLKIKHGRLHESGDNYLDLLRQQRRNKRIAKTRARVEHVFGAVEQMGGKLLSTIGQARANFAMTMMAACYNLKRLVYFKELGIAAL